MTALGLDPSRRRSGRSTSSRLRLRASIEPASVVRARPMQGANMNSVVKLRPVVPDSSRHRPVTYSRRDFGVELEQARRARLLGVHEGHARQDRCARVHPRRKTAAQAVLEGTAGLLRGARARGRRTRRPSRARTDLRAQGEGLAQGYNRRMVAEVWLYPDDSRILELSTKCTPKETFQVAAESRAFLNERGNLAHRRTADEDAQGARDLLGAARTRRSDHRLTRAAERSDPTPVSSGAPRCPRPPRTSHLA